MNVAFSTGIIFCIVLLRIPLLCFMFILDIYTTTTSSQGAGQASMPSNKLN